MKGYVFVILLLVLASCNNIPSKPNTTDKEALKTADTLTGKYVSVSFEGGGVCPLTINISKQRHRYRYHLINNKHDTTGEVYIEDGIVTLKGLKWSSYTNDENENEIVHPDMMVEKNKDTLLIQNYGNTMNQYQKLDCESKYIKLVKKAKKLSGSVTQKL